MYRVSGCIELGGLPPRLARAVAEALEAEARSPPDPGRGVVRVEAGEGVVRVCFEARDLSAARTLVNAYLSLAATVADSVASLGDM